MLAGGTISRLRGGAGERGVDAVEKLLPRRAAKIERTGLHEVLEHALVDRASIDSPGEVLEVDEWSVLFPLRNDLLRGQFAHAFDAPEAEADPRGRDGRRRAGRG